MNVWDKLSNKYDTLWVQKYSLKPSRRKILELINGFKENFSLINTSEEPFSILDVGCATGQLLCELRQIYPQAKLAGIDKSNQMINIAKGKSKNIDFDCLAVEDLDTDSKFDLITCAHSFPYYPSKHEILPKLATLLKDNGRAIFIQASINSTYDKFVMSVIEKTAEKADYLSKKEFCELASRDFRIEDSFTIKEKWFMPSICGFVLGKKL